MTHFPIRPDPFWSDLHIACLSKCELNHNNKDKQPGTWKDDGLLSVWKGSGPFAKRDKIVKISLKRTDPLHFLSFHSQYYTLQCCKWVICFLFRFSEVSLYVGVCFVIVNIFDAHCKWILMRILDKKQHEPVVAGYIKNTESALK